MSTSSNNQSLEKTSDLHVVETRPLIPPSKLHNDIPLDYTSAETVSNTRRSIQNILHNNDPRILVIVGPCSIHDIEAAKDYSEYIQEFRKIYKDKLEIVMRVYFEKPRTTIGWKGLINDPHLDGSYDLHLSQYDSLDDTLDNLLFTIFSIINTNNMIWILYYKNQRIII